MTKRKPAKRRRPTMRGRGRPPFQPTDAQRQLVMRQAAFGMPHDNICGLILKADGKPVTGKTLRQHFRRELDNATQWADVQVVNSLFDQAVGRPAAYDEKGQQLFPALMPSAAPAIWWSKARLGWAEKSKIEMGGPDGGAIPVRIDSLNDAQLGQLIERIDGAIKSRSGGGTG